MTDTVPKFKANDFAKEVVGRDIKKTTTALEKNDHISQELKELGIDIADREELPQILDGLLEHWKEELNEIRERGELRKQEVSETEDDEAKKRDSDEIDRTTMQKLNFLISYLDKDSENSDYKEVTLEELATSESDVWKKDINSISKAEIEFCMVVLDTLRNKNIFNNLRDDLINLLKDRKSLVYFEMNTELFIGVLEEQLEVNDFEQLDKQYVEKQIRILQGLKNMQQTFSNGIPDVLETSFDYTKNIDKGYAKRRMQKIKIS